MANPFDSILAGMPAHKAAVASPPHTPSLSAPIPFSIKSSTNAKKGIIESYLTVYNDPQTGQPFVDSYLDIVDPGSFTKTIAHLTQTQKQANNPYLCLYLWQHDKRSPIGGIKGLTEDSHGVIYEAKINMNVQKGREAFALVEEQQVGGSSYGYDPSVFYYTGDIRHLKEITLHEVSVVSFPANPHARMLSVKSRNTSAGRIDDLAFKMNASFNELERQLHSMHSAFPDLDWTRDADQYQSEVGVGITDLLVSIQREMKR